MIDFLIKSTLSLGILYLFYILVLSGIKTFKFNRYFLLASIVFALAIPFISIPVENNLVPLQDTIEVLLISDSIEQTGVFVNVAQEKGLLTTNILLIFYLAISGILLIRFCINLSNIIRQIRDSKKEKQSEFILVLIKDKVLPHTFFKYILVNDDDYRNERIDEALIQHEEAHCHQRHSLDIVFIEILKIVLWINPFIWLVKKSIQLNHEYLADCSVLANHHLGKYKNILINIVLGNNARILISNFNFSFTKQRLKMMNRQSCKTTGITGIISAILLILILGFTISCKQQSIYSEMPINDDKANVQSADKWLQSFRNVQDYSQIKFNSFNDMFELDSTNSKNSYVVMGDGATAIMILKSKESSSLPKSLTYRELDIEYIYAKNAHNKFYKLTDSDIGSEEVSAPIPMEVIYYQSMERKKRNAANEEKHLNMNEGN